MKMINHLKEEEVIVSIRSQIEELERSQEEIMEANSFKEGAHQGIYPFRKEIQELEDIIEKLEKIMEWI